MDLYNPTDHMPFEIFCSIYYFESDTRFFSLQIWEGMIVRAPKSLQYFVGQQFEQVFIQIKT